jgi:lipopolysaccharide export LptBFGC system permease protein LptF
LEVPLDRHRILMFKNKIYNHLAVEIFKNFITILLTFTAIAWTVRAVNFLDLMIEDGYSANIYFRYSLLNIFTIATRFVPLSFLLSMMISIAKFERQQEFLILWTVGLNKIKIVNIFFLIGFLVSLFQIILSLIINPYTLNKSRSLLRDTNTKQVNSIIKSNDFSDSFKGVTFYIDEKNSKKELINIFIKDSRGSINTVVGNTDDNMNTSIFAKKGMIVQNKLILFDGIIQTLNDNKKIKNINFEKTELSLSNFSTRTITQPKIQEISSYELFKCLNIENSQECVFKNNKKILIETLSRRAGMPLYIPLISIITSFLLIYKKEGKNNHTKKYIIFIFSFIVLILAEILLRYTGFSITNFTLYIFTPLILLIILYTVLIKKMTSKRFENE